MSKQNKLVEFYKKLLEMLDLAIDEKGQIFVKGSQLTPLTINKVPVFLPTQENIRTAVTTENNKIKVVKVLFNPINEDPIKGTSSSLTRLKEIIELKLLGVFYQIGESLLYLMSDTDRDVTTDIKLISFAALLGRYKSPGMKTPVDEKTIDNWVKLYAKILQDNYQTHAYDKIFIKNGGKIGDVKYNKISILSFPFLEELIKINPNKDKFLGMKIRKKDQHDFTSIYEFVYGESVEKLDEGFQFGSMNNVAPTFITLMEIYEFFFNKVKPIITSILKQDPEDDVVEKLTLHPLPIPTNNLADFIEDIKNVVTTIPREDELTKGQQVNRITASRTLNINNRTTTNNTQTENSGGDFWSRMREKMGLPPRTNTSQPVSVGYEYPETPRPVGYVGQPNYGIGGARGVPVNAGYNNGYGTPVQTSPIRTPRVRMGSPRPVATNTAGNSGFVRVGSRAPITNNTPVTGGYRPRGFR